MEKRNSVFTFVAVLLSLLNFSAPTWGADLPPAALELLKTFPEGKVTLPLVISRAIEFSDSYRQLKSQLEAIDVPVLQSRIPLDYRLTFSGARQSNKNEPQLPSFQANSNVGNSVSLGFAKLFESGTSIQVDWSHTGSDIEFASPAVPGFSVYETRLGFKLSQSLVKDFFGFGSRKLLQAGRLNRDAARMNYEDSFQSWTLGLIQAFYGAWLAQHQARSALDTIQRRERMLEVSRLKLKRGTSERPDVLQMENAVHASRVQAAQARQSLGNQWRGLVTTLNLPDGFLGLDPLLVPVGISDPVPVALQACGSDFMQTLPKKVAAVEKSLRQSEAADRLASRARNSKLPDIALFGQVLSNDTDNSSATTTLSEAMKFQHLNWNVGMSLTMPLANYQSRADALSARGDQIRAEAAAASAAADLKLNWLNACADLARLSSVHGLLEENWEIQKERVKLEEGRFSMGRTTTLGVIQAQDDAAQAELSLRSTEVEMWLAAWRVQKMNDGFQTYLAGIKK